MQVSPASLLTIPIRVAVYAVGTAGRLGTAAASRVIRVVMPDGGDDSTVAPPQPPRPEPRSASQPARRPAPRVEPPAPPPSPRRSEPQSPAHVSEEPVLVAESVDPGAADGVGAVIEVEQPWPGYSDARAAAVVERLTQASAEEVAVAQLYESLHRGRRSVLDAAERRLKLLNNPADR